MLVRVQPRPRPAPLARWRDTWENLVWSAKDVNQRKADRLRHEAGLKLLSVPRAPKELPVTALIRNAHGVAEWKLFLNE
jgi:hypothetical protein